MKYAYMDQLMSMKFGEKEIPKPAAGEALIKIMACGICGSDVHFYHEGRCGDIRVTENFILGHEVSGVVAALGDGVSGLKIGDRVCLEPNVTCGKCEMCKSGKYNLCPNVRFFAAPPVPGALQEYVVHPAELCFKLADNVSFEEGALVEPLSVGMHAARQGAVKLGDSVIILGCGCIGLVTLLAVKASGAAKIVAVDQFENRLETAKQFGATHVINAKTQDVAAEIDQLFGGMGSDLVFETAGAVPTIQQTPYFVKRGGTIVLVGTAAESEILYNFSQIMQKEISIKSVFRYRNLYPAAIAAISSGSIQVKPMITHRFTFEQTKEAFDTVVKDAKNVIKGVIRFE